MTLTGPVHQFTLDGVEAMPSTHMSCATCSTRIASRNDAVPGMTILRAGTLGDSDTLVPAVHIWISRKQPWLAISGGTPCFDETPTPQQFMSALA